MGYPQIKLNSLVRHAKKFDEYLDLMLIVESMRRKHEYIISVGLGLLAFDGDGPACGCERQKQSGGFSVSDPQC